ncbi:MAG TPA: CRISPR-associated endonuclease Cas1 [Firmicutes bacterium]|nr:CRISPR-associated endonuclease Cas1 [Bacillota bacterium]
MEHLILDEFGTFLSKRSERLVVKKNGQVALEVPFANVEQVTIACPGVGLSTDFLRECVEHGIQINFVSSSGSPYAKIVSPNLVGTVMTRREQLAAYSDVRGAELGRAFVMGKVHNQANVLRYFAKHRKESDPVMYESLYDAASRIDSVRREIDRLGGTTIDELRPQLLSIEGRAATHYWECLKKLVSSKVDFPGREHREATDPLNSMLNYGYGILYHTVWGAVILAGLDEFAGFIHVDRPGKPSLVLDLVEEFRPHLIDRPLIVAVLRGMRIGMDKQGLTLETRREIAERIGERLEAQDTYDGKKLALKAIIQRQARAVAAHVRREGRYRAFVAGW